MSRRKLGRRWLPVAAVVLLVPGLLPAQAAHVPSHAGYARLDLQPADIVGRVVNQPGEKPAAALDRWMTHPREAASAAAVAQRRSMTGNGVPGTGGRWQQFGRDSELDNVGDYTPIDNIPTMSGRVQDFALNRRSGHLIAAVGSGGLWETADNGNSWRPIADALPTQMVGAVAWTPAGGGTIIAGTGDSGFGYLGLGAWRSTDDGANWQRAAGVPDQIMSFRAVVDPTNPDVIYLATSRGLYRSGDAGVSFANVNIPTGCTTIADPRCFFANFVTDVVVRPADANGTAGGKVLAAVGWVRGNRVTKPGWTQSPGNGLYASAKGMPGTFNAVSAKGLPSQERMGRISLDVAAGSGQNHDVIWMMLQDAARMNGQPETVTLPTTPPASTGWSTLNGIYSSADFGTTWTLQVDASELAAPTTGTDLSGPYLAPAPVGYSYGPGVQSWYNNWIRIDPTSTDAASGQPTRILGGLEEVWEFDSDPSTATTQAHVIGNYYGGLYCPETNAGLPAQVPTSVQNQIYNPPACPFMASSPTTTHPDQHGAIIVPDGKGGITLWAGNDGGVYRQHVSAGQALNNDNWGSGANSGLHTLLPYMAVMAKDGTAYAGLQDNGEMRVTPDGRQVEVFGGDGGYSAVDPNNSSTVYEEYVGGSMAVSTDAGHNWTSINPTLTNAQFITPFVMDPHNANHLMAAGEDIQETISGPSTTTSPWIANGVAAPASSSPTAATDWVQDFDLGSTNGMANTTTAVDLAGPAAYVGWCGGCYVPTTLAFGFKSGIATNVGGSAVPLAMTGNGWHLAKAEGLPNRMVTHVAMDPGHPATVYVTLGDEDVAYRYLGALGDDTSKIGRGHVFRSTDAGEHFTDISGNLPDSPAYWVSSFRGGQLLVATAVGVFVASDTSGTTYGLLGGDELPPVPVMSVVVDPAHADRLLIATYGRGLYTYAAPSDVTPIPSAAQGSVHGATQVKALPNTAGFPVSLPVAPLLPILLWPLAVVRMVRSRQRGSGPVA